MANKKFALMAMAVGAIGIIIGGYSIVTVTNTIFVENNIQRDTIDIISVQGIDVSKGSPLLGSEDAPITIIVFGDYQCLRCDQWYLDQRAIMEKYANTVNMYFLDLPLLGSDSFIAAEASYCAEDQNKYWEYHKMLHENQGDIDDGWANKDNLLRYAEQLGLDTKMFEECLDTNKYKDRVEYNRSVGLNLEVKETPTFFIIDNVDGKIVKIGIEPIEVFEKTIDAMLK